MHRKLIQIDSQVRNQQLQNKSDENEYDEQISIWDERDLSQAGISAEFIDERGNQLEFYQLYRLRSVLYQPKYVSRINTIKEVNSLQKHFNQKISINQLKQQQIYLDKYFMIQKKEYKQRNEQISDQMLQNQQEKSLIDNFFISNLTQQPNLKKIEIQEQTKKQTDQDIHTRNLNQSQILFKNVKNQKFLQFTSQNIQKTNSSFSQCRSSLFIYQKKRNHLKENIQLNQDILLFSQIETHQKPDNNIKQMDSSQEFTQQLSQQTLIIQNELQIIQDENQSKNKKPSSSNEKFEQKNFIDTRQNKNFRESSESLSNIFQIFSLIKKIVFKQNCNNQN
ncbi:hypothetical protein ABPG73_000606 [Tetrahymena malaccensis]